MIKIRDKKLKRAFLSELKKEQREKVFNTGKGPKAFLKDKTHKISLEMEDGLWFDAGFCKIGDDRPVVWRKEIDGEWITINDGAVISFKAKENNWIDKETGAEIKGNPQIVSASVDLEKNGPENTNPFIYNPSGPSGGDRNTDSGGQKQWTKKDYSGVEIGHSLNCGLLAAKHSLKDISKVLELSKNLHEITKKIKKEYKEKYPKMSDYDLGAMVGNSILNACRVGGKISTIESNARKILDELVPSITAYVRGEEVETKTPDKVVEEEVLPDDDPPF